MLLVVDARFVGTKCYWMLLDPTAGCSGKVLRVLKSDLDNSQGQHQASVQPLRWGPALGKGPWWWWWWWWWWWVFDPLILVNKSTCTFNVLTHMHFCCVGSRGGDLFTILGTRAPMSSMALSKSQKEQLKSLENNAITQTDPNLKSIASEYLTIHRDRYTQKQTCNRYIIWSSRPDYGQNSLSNCPWPWHLFLVIQPSSQWPVVF